MHTTTAIGRPAFGLVAVCALVLAGCGGSGNTGPSGARLTLRPVGSVDDAPAGYAEYLPPGYGDGKPRPLLLFLHGAGSNGNGTEAALQRVLATGLPRLIREHRWPADRPFVVLMPQHSNSLNYTCPRPEQIQRYLAYALRRYDVDRKRVYLTGLSCGATGAWDYLAVHADEVVAAAVLIAGDGSDALEYAGCKLGRVPIWAFHGADDPVVDPSTSVVPITVLRACTDPRPADARLTVYPGVGHDAWDRTYDLSAGHDIYAWLLGHEHT